MKKRRPRIVPEVVFATAVSAFAIPALVTGCGGSDTGSGSDQGGNAGKSVAGARPAAVATGPLPADSASAHRSPGDRAVGPARVALAMEDNRAPAQTRPASLQAWRPRASADSAWQPHSAVAPTAARAAPPAGKRAVAAQQAVLPLPGLASVDSPWPHRSRVAQAMAARALQIRSRRNGQHRMIAARSGISRASPRFERPMNWRPMSAR